MLFKTDSQHGHVIDDTPAGPVYRADGVLVDDANPRPCVGCKAHINPGEHDPCIANLPGAYQACCGHGLDRTPVRNAPNGYVAFKDGRCIRFSGLVGGVRIRQAVDAVLAGKDLPEGFAFDEGRAWWEGLTDEQRARVQESIPAGLARKVLEVTGSPAHQGFLDGEKPWWEGLSEEHKSAVWAQLGTMMAQLVQEALAAE